MFGVTSVRTTVTPSVVTVSAFTITVSLNDPGVGVGVGVGVDEGEGDGDGDELLLVAAGFITIVCMVTGATGDGGAVQVTVTLTRL